MLFMREVQAGDYCGYSFASAICGQHKKLAVVDIEYGDGIYELVLNMKYLSSVNATRYVHNDEPYVC